MPIYNSLHILRLSIRVMRLPSYFRLQQCPVIVTSRRKKLYLFTKNILLNKGALSGLKQFLATENLLKMMKKCFLFHPESSFRSKDN